MSQELSILLTVLAYTLLSTGFVLMKKGIGWIGYKGKKDKVFTSNLLYWIAGFLLTNSYIVPNTVALKYLEPHIVSAMAGWGVIVLILLSSWVLRERLFRLDYIYTLLIVLSIVLLNFFEVKEPRESFNTVFLATSSVLPFLLLIPAFIRTLPKKVRTILFAAVSGLSTGLIIVMMKLVVSRHAFLVADYFSSPPFYMYLVFSLLAFISLQAAYKLGAMMTVGPVQYSLGIIYPVLCSFLVFSNRLHPIQWITMTAIIFSVISILKKRTK